MFSGYVDALGSCTAVDSCVYCFSEHAYLGRFRPVKTSRFLLASLSCPSDGLRAYKLCFFPIDSLRALLVQRAILLQVSLMDWGHFKLQMVRSFLSVAWDSSILMGGIPSFDLCGVFCLLQKTVCRFGGMAQKLMVGRENSLGVGGFPSC